MKKALFLINGVGLGNSTRCHGVISALREKGFSVHVATSGNGFLYFSQCPDVEKVIPLRGGAYGNSGGRLSLWRTAGLVPLLLLTLARNILTLLPLFARGGYAVVVADSDYTSWMARLFFRLPVVAINNASWVMEECRMHADVRRAGRWQYWIEVLDHFYHRVAPDYLLMPGFDEGFEGDMVRSFPPLVRSGLARSAPSEPKKVLLMASGSEFGFQALTPEELARFPSLEFTVLKNGKSEGNVTFLGRTTQNHSLLNETDILVVNGGYSAVAEGIWLKKPMLVIPVEGHAEQAANAHYVEEQGLGLVATQSTIASQLEKLLAGYPNFVAAHEAQEFPLDGASSAADWIAQIAR